MATKILIVEDDKSLLEIYIVRLQAEGYIVVSASDGEQALAVAIKERPNLVITDVMMPKISGFDMLDILRSTAETKDIKVIMMTALSSDDQRSRGERMGADRYLVKSQVGIEDVVRTVHEVLGDSGAAATPATAQPAAPATSTPAAPQVATAQTPPAVTTSQPPAVSPSASQPSVAPVTPVQLQTSTVPPTPSSKQRIIQPLTKHDDKVDINDLLDKELAKEAGLDMPGRPQVATVDQERAIMQDQLKAAEQPAPAAQPAGTAATAPTEAPQQPTPPVQPPPQAAPNQAVGPRPAPTVPPRDKPLQAPPRIPTI